MTCYSSHFVVSFEFDFIVVNLVSDEEPQAGVEHGEHDTSNDVHGAIGGTSLTAEHTFAIHDVSIIDVSFLHTWAELSDFLNLFLSKFLRASSVILHGNNGAIGKFKMEPEANDSILWFNWDSRYSLELAEFVLSDLWWSPVREEWGGNTIIWFVQYQGLFHCNPSQGCQKLCKL